MTHEEALRKAIACLKLAQSPNQHEAALAASKAQEIIDRYQLTIDSVPENMGEKEIDEPICDFKDDPLADICLQDQKWTRRLAAVIASVNGCRIYGIKKHGGGVKISIVGRPRDVQTARYIFQWLDREVRRITSEEAKGHSQDYKKSFRFGAVETIRERLQAQQTTTIQSVRREAAHNPLALAVVERNIAKIEKRKAALDAWVGTHLRLVTSASSNPSNNAGREHGRRAGHSVRFTSARGSIAGGGKGLT